MVGWPKGFGGRSRREAEEHTSDSLPARGAPLVSAVQGATAGDVSSWSFADDSIDAPWGRDARWAAAAVIHAPRAGSVLRPITPGP